MKLFKDFGENDNKDPYVAETFKYIGIVTEIGVAMILSILVFLGIGLAINKYIYQSSIIVLVCILIGVFSGFYLAYNVVDKVLKDGD